MRKITNMFLFTLVVLSVLIVPFASAEDVEVTEVEIEEEIETMSLEERAGYRFDQLAISLENQIESGKDILAGLNVSEDIMIELEGYVVDLEALLEKTNSVDLTLEPADLAAEFLVVKKEAINISKSFRTTMNSEVKGEKISEMKANLAHRKEIRKEEAKLKLEEKKEEASAKRGVRLLEELGIEVDEGKTAKETKVLVKEAIENLSEEEKEELKAEINTERELAKAEGKSKKTEVKAEIKNKKAEIKDEIIAKKEIIRAKIGAEVQERRAELQGMDVRLDKEEIQARMQDKNVHLSKDEIRAGMSGKNVRINEEGIQIEE